MKDIKFILGKLGIKADIKRWEEKISKYELESANKALFPTHKLSYIIQESVEEIREDSIKLIIRKLEFDNIEQELNQYDVYVLSFMAIELHNGSDKVFAELHKDPKNFSYFAVIKDLLNHMKQEYPGINSSELYYCMTGLFNPIFLCDFDKEQRTPYEKIARALYLIDINQKYANSLLQRLSVLEVSYKLDVMSKLTGVNCSMHSTLEGAVAKVEGIFHMQDAIFPDYYPMLGDVVCDFGS